MKAIWQIDACASSSINLARNWRDVVEICGPAYTPLRLRITSVRHAAQGRTFTANWTKALAEFRFMTTFLVSFFGEDRNGMTGTNARSLRFHRNVNDKAVAALERDCWRGKLRNL